MCVFVCLLPLTWTIFTTLPTYSYMRTRLHCGISMPSSATDVAMRILLLSELLKDSRTPFILFRVIPVQQQQQPHRKLQNTHKNYTLHWQECVCVWILTWAVTVWFASFSNQNSRIQETQWICVINPFLHGLKNTQLTWVCEQCVCVCVVSDSHQRGLVSWRTGPFGSQGCYDIPPPEWTSAHLVWGSAVRLWPNPATVTSDLNQWDWPETGWYLTSIKMYNKMCCWFMAILGQK